MEISFFDDKLVELSDVDALSLEGGRSIWGEIGYWIGYVATLDLVTGFEP